MTPSSLSAGPAPWRALFLQHISAMSQASFTLSTVHHSDTPVSTTTTWTPRARTCMFRGMWATLLPNDRNPAPRNPAVFESDLPLFTTDVRMAKAADLTPGAVPGGGTGGGGAVEAVWWVPESQTQWRIRGTAWVLGPDVGDDSLSATTAREAIGARTRRVGGDEAVAAEWSWAREVTALFGELSPAMRGTFRNPPPGTPRSVPGGDGEGLGQVVEDLHDR